MPELFKTHLSENRGVVGSSPRMQGPAQDTHDKDHFTPAQWSMWELSIHSRSGLTIDKITLKAPKLSQVTQRLDILLHLGVQ